MSSTCEQFIKDLQDCIILLSNFYHSCNTEPLTVVQGKGKIALESYYKLNEQLHVLQTCDKASTKLVEALNYELEEILYNGKLHAIVSRN